MHKVEIISESESHYTVRYGNAYYWLLKGYVTNIRPMREDSSVRIGYVYEAYLNDTTKIPNI